VPSHIQLVVRNDQELSKLREDVAIANRGVMSNIHNLLVPKKVVAHPRVLVLMMTLKCWDLIFMN